LSFAAKGNALKKKLMQNDTTKTKFKVPTKQYRIGEVVGYTPFTRQTIHNYTVMGLIQESGWTQGGHRLYNESVFERLSTILELRKTKTLAQIRQIMRSDKQQTTNTGVVAS
jgi:DNA-binding transcriptional MerR regulator